MSILFVSEKLILTDIILLNIFNQVKINAINC